MRTLADAVGKSVAAQRVEMGRRGLFRRNLSPAGFPLRVSRSNSRVELELLLPDGRLWEYSSRFHAMAPEGRYVDLHARKPPLIAEVLGYLFVDTDGQLGAKQADADAKTYRVVDLDEALDAIASDIIRRQRSSH